MPLKSGCETLAQQLTSLYAAALVLPDVTPRARWPDAAHDEDAWNRVHSSFKAFFRDRDTYWTVFDPRAEEVLVVATLSDDIADVYGDLKSGLDIQRVAELDAAVWEWRNAFWSHWGRHVVESVRVLHWLAKEG